MVRPRTKAEILPMGKEGVSKGTSLVRTEIPEMLNLFFSHELNIIILF